MIRSLLSLLTFLAALGSGLIAGVFFGFSSFVMPALGRIAPREGIAAMQAINIVVLNPSFLGVYLGTALACLLLIVTALLGWSDPGSGFLLAGGLLYLIGTIGVTGAYNIPRNNALSALRADSAEAATYWVRFIGEWTLGNHVRTAASLGAAALFTLALLRRTPAHDLFGALLAALPFGGK